VTGFFNPLYMAEVEVVFRLRVRGEKIRTARNLLVVSTHGLSSAELAALRESYLAHFRSGFVSFPLKERASHLMTRIDERVFNFGRFVINWLPQFRIKKYAVPRGRALEMMVRLSPEENDRLQAYLGNILENRARTIGKFKMDGHQFTTGAIAHNVTLRGGHNCSSWIATAPIGPSDEALMELLGAERTEEIGTNPGWWTNWLAVAAPPERLPFVIHWTPKPLAEALREIAPGENFTWDFNRH
jgi:hypothetical protein